MKLVARHDEVIGRVVIKRVRSAILRLNEFKNTTKFLLVDAVGPDAAEKGIKVGDVVLARTIDHLKFDAGTIVRFIAKEPSIAIVVEDVDLEEFAIQVDNGEEYVAFGDEFAAQSICGNAPAGNGKPVEQSAGASA